MNKKQKIAALLEKCKNYDRVAQKELYLHYADLLMNTAIRYAKDRAQAEDLVHDAFMKIFQNITQYQEQGSSFEGWIKRILINEALKGFRKSNRMTSMDEESLLGIVSDDSTAIEFLEAEDVLKLLNKLPEGCKTIFNLYVIEGFKHEEIGRLLNIKASASRAQLSRAKKLLRKLLQGTNPSITE